MTQRSYFWDGITTGHASLAPYSNDEFSDFWSRVALRNRATHGLIATTSPSVNDMPSQFELEKVSNNQIKIRPGCALVDGKMFLSKKSITYSLQANFYYRFFINKHWESQTVRVGYSMGFTGYPDLVQYDGVSWQIPLWRARWDGAILTIIDDRGFINLPTMLYRVGGDALDWSVPGANVYRQPRVALQFGAVQVAASPTTITFANSFNVGTKPIVLVTLLDLATAPSTTKYWISAITNTSFTIRMTSVVNLDGIMYVALGIHS